VVGGDEASQRVVAGKLHRVTMHAGGGVGAM
jgi:hypothetical protein